MLTSFLILIYYVTIMLKQVSNHAVNCQDVATLVLTLFIYLLTKIYLQKNNVFHTFYKDNHLV